MNNFSIFTTKMGVISKSNKHKCTCYELDYNYVQSHYSITSDLSILGMIQ